MPDLVAFEFSPPTEQKIGASVMKTSRGSGTAAAAATTTTTTTVAATTTTTTTTAAAATKSEKLLFPTLFEWGHYQQISCACDDYLAVLACR